MSLWLLEAPIGDLRSLSDCRHLEFLYLEGTAVPDLDSLAGLARLTGLVLNHVGRPPAGLHSVAETFPRLEKLSLLHGEWVTDLTPLARMQELRRIDMRHLPVTSIQPLIELPHLESVYLGYMNFDERSARLDLVATLTRISRLHELAFLSPIHDLDLTPLEGRGITVRLPPGMLNEKMRTIGGLTFVTWPA